MSRVVSWLQYHEHRMFFWVNRKMYHAAASSVLSVVTHLGGATATILFCLGVALFGGSFWSIVGWQSLAALAASHIPVAIIKKKYPRLRPYLVLPETNTCKKPLTDHSFPSGHTTAIFSVLIPFILANPALGTVLFPLAMLVGLSRIYLGLHYPSDCIVGGCIGLISAICSVSLIG